MKPIVQLIQSKAYDPEIDDVSGWTLSEKFNGISGLLLLDHTEGAYADRFNFSTETRKGREIASGLWNGRSGKVIMMPKWWRDFIPRFPVAGELWTKRDFIPRFPVVGELWTKRGPGALQEVQSITSKLKPVDKEWEKVKFMAHALPSAYHLGLSKEWRYISFEVMQRKLLDAYSGTIHQLKLSSDRKKAAAQVQRLFKKIVARGGEGVVLRDPMEIWRPGRQDYILRLKAEQKGSGKVIGYIAAKEGKTGHLLGLMGALVVKIEDGKQFTLSGFQKHEREVSKEGGPAHQMLSAKWVHDHPGELFPGWIRVSAFPLGTIVRFKYEELSVYGIPLKPRYLRSDE